MKTLEEFLTPTQTQLFKNLCEMCHGKSLYVKGKFILVKGTAPILLVAHLDTVHKEPVRDICTSADGNILMSPQGIGGDDRCGVYALVNAYEQSAIKPNLLFTCNEEVGGIGAKYFAYLHSLGKLPKSLDKLKFIVEVDRKGRSDAVYYDCTNKDFETYITSKGYKTAKGTFTDISIIAPKLGIAAVNLSSGYYNAHQLCEYINRKELDVTLAKILTMITDAAQKDFPQFEYLSAFHDFIPQSIPKEYAEIYEELLYDYSSDELEYFRSAYGDKVLWELYSDLYQPFYDKQEKF